MDFVIKLLSIWYILLVSYWQCILSLSQTNRINTNNYRNISKGILLQQYHNEKDYDGRQVLYNSSEMMKFQKASNKNIPTFEQLINSPNKQQLKQIEEEYIEKYILAHNSSLLCSLILTSKYLRQPEEMILSKLQTNNDGPDNRTMMFNGGEQPVKNNGNVDTEDVADDDLIIPILKQQQQQQQQHEKNSQQIYKQIDLLKATTTTSIKATATTTTTTTSSSSTTTTSSRRSTTIVATATGKYPMTTLNHMENGHLPLIHPNASSHSKLTTTDPTHIHIDSNHYNNNSNKDIDENWNRPHQIELSNQYGNYDSSTTTTILTSFNTSATIPATPTTPTIDIDMNDFLKLIPIEQVQNIMYYYYTNDVEVKCLYRKLAHPYFYYTTQNVQNLPEINDFLIYLKQNGFHLLQFLNALIKILTINTITIQNLSNTSDICYNFWIRRYLNDITAATTPETSITFSIPTLNTTAESPLEILTGGIDGLVESLLDILPQDQFFETFIEKMEKQPAFAHLLEEFGSDTFQGHLHNIRNCPELKPIVASLNGNGLYFGKIFQQIQTWMSF